MKEKIIEIKDFTLHYVTKEETVEALTNVSLTLEKGETLGIVGETGAGKTSLALSILQLIQQPPGEYIKGEIFYKGLNMIEATKNQKRDVRGKEISMIFQDPMTALNPVMRIGKQIEETIVSNLGENEEIDVKKKALEMLELVGIDEYRYNDFPHQFSGGMKQRAIIAMALSCEPNLLIADEPTTALDVTIQAQVLELMKKLRDEYKMSMILITHDLGVVSEICDKVAIIYGGEIIEYGTLKEVYENTLHPYTEGLFNSIPSLSKEATKLIPIPGLTPDPTNLPKGCIFAERCKYKKDECVKERPKLMGDTHKVRCLHPINGVK